MIHYGKRIVDVFLCDYTCRLLRKLLILAILFGKSLLEFVNDLMRLGIESVRCFLPLLETAIYLAVLVLDTIDIYKIKNRWYKTIGFCVSTDLFFRAVASQVFSAQLSLTSVFGMGTGGPSTLKALTSLYILLVCTIIKELPS